MLPVENLCWGLLQAFLSLFLMSTQNCLPVGKLPKLLRRVKQKEKQGPLGRWQHIRSKAVFLVIFTR